MKRLCLFLSVGAALFTLVNASIWEGAAAVAAGGELPETGLFMATNSFPVNTVVDVTNLENGKTIRVIASQSLETSGLLAILSKEAAGAIDLQGGTLGRIRMSQPPDPVAFSRFTEGLASSGDPDFDPAAFVALNAEDKEKEKDTVETENNKDTDLIDDLDTGIVPEPKPQAAVDSPPVTPGPDYDLSLIPSENRPPLPIAEPEPVAPAAKDRMDLSPFVDPVSVTPGQSAPLSQEAPVSSGLPVFSAPLINSLDKGRYYLQIAAYSKEDTVRSEIAKIDKNLPVAIMNAGNPEKPVYRILIGPVNLGESGALLQRFKANYKDAFVRLGS